MAEHEDQLIIQKVLNGQPAAYAELVNRYRHFVFTLAIRYVKNREEAEELSQDVFVKAYRFLPSFKGNSKFSTWLYSIVNSTCLSFLRNKKQNTLFPGNERLTFLSDLAVAGEAEDIAAGSRKQLIQMAVNKLPREESLIITLFYMEGQSVEEIGKIMELSVSNVKVKLFRSREKLRMIINNLKEFH